MSNAINSSKTQLLSVRMPHDLVARMKERSKYTGQTMTNLFTEAVAYYLDNVSAMEAMPEIVDDIEEVEEEKTLPPWSARRTVVQRGLYGKGGRGR